MDIYLGPTCFDKHWKMLYHRYPRPPDFVADENTTVYAVEKRPSRWKDRLEKVKQFDQTLFIFHEDHSLRKFCLVLQRSKWKLLAAELFIFICILMRIGYSYSLPFDTAVNALDVTISVYLLLDHVISMIALGVYFQEGAFYRSPYRILEFFIICVSLIMSGGYSRYGVNSVLLVRCIPVGGQLWRQFIIERRRKCNYDDHTLDMEDSLNPLQADDKFFLEKIVSAVSQCISPMITNLILVLFFFMLYGMMMQSFFSTIMKRQCLIDDLDGTPIQVIQGPVLCKAGTESCGTAVNGSYCEANQDPVNQGITNTDRMPSVLLLLFVFVSLEGWGWYMFQFIEAEGSVFIGLWFTSLILIMNFIVINIFVGLVTSVFENIDEVQRHAEGVIDSEDYRIKWLGRLMNSIHVHIFVYLLIVINLFILASDHDNISDAGNRLINICEIIFNTIFTLEALLKIIGFGPKLYFSEMWNRTDLFIALLSVVSLVFQYTTSMNFNLSAFRGVRLLRILQSIPALKSLSRLVQGVLNCIIPCLNVLVFIFISIVGFSICGFMLYYRLRDSESSSIRPNYHTWPSSLLTVFMLMTADNWPDTMFAIMKRIDMSCCVFYIFLFIYCIVCLNMFTAVVLREFSNEEETRNEEVLQGVDSPTVESNEHKTDSWFEKIKSYFTDSPDTKEVIEIKKEIENVKEQLIGVYSQEGDPIELSSYIYNTFRLKSKPGMTDKTLNLFSPESRVRKFCWTLYVINSRFFQAAVMFIACVAVAVMWFEPPREAAAKLNSIENDSWHRYVDIVIIILLSAETIIIIIAKGLFQLKGAYLRSPMNCLDTIIIVILCLSYLIPTLQSVRLLRLIRLVRLCRAIPSARQLLNSLWDCLNHVIAMILLTIYISLLLAITGLSNFKGLFYSCNDSPLDQTDCTNSLLSSDSVLVPRAWLNYASNFDNIWNALLVMAECSTFSNLFTFLYLGADSTQKGKSPSRYSHWYTVFYFVVVFIVLGMFLSQVFIGVIVDAIKRSQYGFVTEEQKAWKRKRKFVMSLKSPKTKRPKPSKRLRSKIFNLITNPFYVKGVTMIIILKIIFNAFVDDYVSYSASRVTDVIFLCTIGLDLFLTMFSLRKAFWKDPFNVFNFIVTTLTILFTLVRTWSAHPFVRLMLDLLTIARIIQGARITSGLYKFLMSIVASAPAAFSVLVLLLIMIFGFSYIGKIMMGNIRYRGAFNKFTNLREMGVGMLLLFQIVTFDNWNVYMYETRMGSGTCTAIDGFNDCGSGLGIPFFLVFITMGAFIVTNLVVSLIADRISSLFESDPISRAELQWLEDCWQKSDRKCDGGILTYRFSEFLANLRMTKTQFTNLRHRPWYSDVSMMYHFKFYSSYASRHNPQMMKYRHLVNFLLVHSENWNALTLHEQREFLVSELEAQCYICIEKLKSILSLWITLHRLRLYFGKDELAIIRKARVSILQYKSQKYGCCLRDRR